MKNAIRFAFYDKKNTTPEKLAKSIESEGIHVVFRKSKDGQLYGITYVDHKTQCVFNGSSLGKDFSAKGIQENCAINILAIERKYQNSVSQNFQNLEFKENLADILLRGEKINDFVSKQFKKKKKKRLYKGI